MRLSLSACPALLTMAVAAAVASSCVDRRTESLAGEPCTDEPPVCGDWSFLYECHAGTWRPIFCDDRCWAIASNLEASGCEMRIDGPDLCTCRYTDSNSICKEEEIHRCASSQALAACTPGQERSCADRCAIEPEAPVSAGCDFDASLEGDRCYCTSEGAPCNEPRWNQCFGDDVLVHCTDSTWTLTPCAEICGAQDVPCRFDPSKNEAYCACELAD